MTAPYELQLTIPPNTPTSSPIVLGLDVADSHIRHVDLFFPDGCFFAVGVRITDRSAQYAPRDSGWIRDNGRSVSWDDDHELAGPPSRITIEGYSDADDFTHTIEVRIITGGPA